MSAYKRILFVKKFYPDYVVFILKNREKITFDDDLKIVNLINSKQIINKNINYIILDNTNIIEKRVFMNNNYYYYYKLSLLIDVIKYIGNKRV